MEQKKSYLLGNRRNSKVLSERKVREYIREFYVEADKLKTQIEDLENSFQVQFSEQKNEQAAIVRELMKVKWSELERQAKETEQEDDILECLICGNKEQRKNLEIKLSECMFNGGILKRYVCLCCGAIFGPSKFSKLTQQEKDEDYYVHYLGFSEGDSTEKELRAFYMLNPTKEGIYLNYGCGNWSKSMQILRDKGYTIYGYEPYARNENNNPYIITEKKILEKMRFDGIYSNDVIEHLINPIEGFEFMKSLLRDSQAKMSHSTSCYIYKHEETRFHTYFFTGDSLSFLCKRTGLAICDSINDEKENDFICHVFCLREFEFDFLPLMHTQGACEWMNGGIMLRKNSTLFGPYLDYPKGKLKLRINLQLGGQKKLIGLVTADSGHRLLKEFELVDGENTVELFLEKLEKDVEVVIRVPEDGVLVKNITQI